jgi:outer membrane protein assembly factor BamE (lipoprotein component of BamABCDE complex)
MRFGLRMFFEMKIQQIPLARLAIYGAALALFTASSACSVAMEASRPEPTDMSQFVLGEQRAQVQQVLGPPTATSVNAGQTYDSYTLYTKGPNAMSRAAIAGSEAVADVLTLGLTEIVLTPAEAITRNEKHPV